MNFSSLLVRYYNWYKYLVVCFLLCFFIFFGFTVLFQKKKRNDVYTDFLIKKHLYKNDIKNEKKDLVDSRLTDLDILLNILNNKLNNKIKILELTLSKKNSTFLLESCEFLYAYFIIANNLNHTAKLDIILNKIDDAHIYFLDMCFLKVVYMIQKNNFIEAEKSLNYLVLMNRQNKKLFMNIDKRKIEALKYYIEKNKNHFIIY